MRTSYISNEADNKRRAVQVQRRIAEAADTSLDADQAHLNAVEVCMQQTSTAQNLPEELQFDKPSTGFKSEMSC